MLSNIGNVHVLCIRINTNTRILSNKTGDYVLFEFRYLSVVSSDFQGW